MTFNNTVFSSGKIEGVTTLHPTIERLYLAAKELRDVNGQSAVARLLERTPQVVKNWEARGISNEGALQAQKIIGCDANWLLDGITSMRNAAWTPELEAQTPKNEPAGLDQTLKDLATHIARIEPSSREKLNGMFAALLIGPDSEETVEAIKNHIENAPLKKRGAPEFGAQQPQQQQQRRAA